MDATHYWLFAREYTIWNAAITTLQFWMADLNPLTLCNAMGLHSLLLQQFCPAVKDHIKRNIIWLLHDHTK